MSIFSEYRCGSLSDEEFKNECIRMNNEEKAEGMKCKTCRFFEDTGDGMFCWMNEEGKECSYERKRSGVSY